MSEKYVFISYSHDDVALTENVADFLRTEGLAVRYDDRIEVGAEYKPQILQMIREAGCTLVIWTKQSVGKTYVLFEAAAAHALGKLVPARDGSVTSSEIPAALNTLQAIAIYDRSKLLAELRKRLADADRVSLSRRQLLLGGAIFGMASVASASLHPTTKKVLSSTVSPLLDNLAPALPQNCRDVAKMLLLGTGHNVHVVPSLNNPYSLAAGITKPTRHAARSLARLFRSEDVALVENTRQFDYYGNLVLLGGPLANQTTRLIMGSDGVSELTKGMPNTLSLPFHFDIDRSIARFERKEPGSWRAETEHRERRSPVWTVYRNGREFVRPKLVEYSLVNDFLIVTSLPNILNQASYENGSRITMLSGAHSVGMRAVHDLLESSSIMERLLAEGHGKQAWQALLTIDDVHSNGFPRSIHPSFDLAEVKADFGAIARELGKERAL